MRYLYTVLFYLALPFLFVRLLWRSRRAPAYRTRWAERLGYCPFELKESIWVHSVSVGETIAAIPLIKALKKRYPNLQLVITNMTPTGSARVKAAFGDSVYNAFVPYDVPVALRLFMQRIKPRVLIIMETELWPNLLAVTHEQHVPIIVTNARLSEKSAQGYRRIAGLTRGMLNVTHTVAAQAQPDAERFISLGMPSDRVVVTGNLKFDLELAPDLATKSAELRQQLGSDRPIWIAASTHPGEEEIILAAHQKILQSIPQALLILVPRHPERFDAVAELITQQGLRFVRRSQGAVCDAATQVYLSDTMGEMMMMYSVCDVAFVAGSFAMIGGHNMLEPAAVHKPVVTGPQLYNFAEISAWMIEAQGMVTVQDSDELARVMIELLSDHEKRHRMGEQAYQVVERNRGAMQKQLAVIEKVISSPV